MASRVAACCAGLAPMLEGVEVGRRREESSGAAMGCRRGFQLIEVSVVAVLIASLTTLMLPQFFSRTAAVRVGLASQEVASALYSSRLLAIRQGRNVAIQFQTWDDGSVHFQQFVDGDGDGVSTSDIEQGIDPSMSPARELAHLGRGVVFGFPPGEAPIDPGDPDRRLDRLDDPIRFNRSDLASFTPLGTSTPGSVYLTDSRSELRVVRLLGTSARIRILRYDSDKEHWY